MSQVLGLLCSLLTASFSKLSEAEGIGCCRKRSKRENVTIRISLNFRDVHWVTNGTWDPVHSNSIYFVIPKWSLGPRRHRGQVLFNAEEPQADGRSEMLNHSTTAQCNGVFRVIWCDGCHFVTDTTIGTRQSNCGCGPYRYTSCLLMGCFGAGVVRHCWFFWLLVMGMDNISSGRCWKCQLSNRFCLKILGFSAPKFSA